MERFGTAWEKTEAEMADGYPEPRFDGDGPLFCATVWPHPAFATVRTPPSRQGGGISGEISGGMTGGPAQSGRGEAARRRQAILDALARSNGLDARKSRPWAKGPGPLSKGTGLVILVMPRRASHGALGRGGARKPRREPRGRVVLRHVMHVEHRRRDVGLPHIRLDLGERKLLDGERAERAPQIVRSQVLDPRCVAEFCA